MRTKNLEAVRFHVRTMYANGFRISPPQAKIAGGGETDNNIYLTTSDGLFLTDGVNELILN